MIGVLNRVRHRLVVQQRWVSQSLYEEFCNVTPTSSTPNEHIGNLSVLVVHPKVRWGSGSASILKDPQRQLNEAVTLVNTLPNMIVVDNLVVPVDYNTKRKSVWARGNLERLVEKKEACRATALMVNVDMLSVMQHEELFQVFGVPIFDRYEIVMSIFKAYADTEEAMLQIELAQLPYIKARFSAMNTRRQPMTETALKTTRPLSFYHGKDWEEMLRKREQDLRRQLKNVQDEKSAVYNKTSDESAVVSIVGYTNAGKTSLVKKLTGSEELVPKDQLFATLDTTRHHALLPSGRKVALVDTIGFISDIPTSLIAAFEATLSHVKYSDVIVHIRDISNDDWEAQNEDVLLTLQQIGVNEEMMKEKMITVDNKVDRTDRTQSDSDARISCETGQGVRQLVEALDEKVIQATDCAKIRLKLSTASPVISYLYRERLVSSDPEIEDDELVFDLVLSRADIGKMNSRFPGLV